MDASSAFWLTQVTPSPAGSINPFCEPLTHTSTPHSSMRKSMLASALTESTNRRAGMLDAVHGLAHRGDVAGHAGRRLILTDEHGLDLVLLVRAQRGEVAVDGCPLAPGRLEYLDLVTEALAHVDPQVAELTEARGEHLVAGVQAIGQRRFPAAGSGGGKNERRARRGLEYRLEAREARPGELRENRRAMVFHRNHHGPRHPLGYIGGAGHE